MTEIIDILFFCWCLLALGVYVLGQIFEEQIGKLCGVKRVGEVGDRSRYSNKTTTNLDDVWPTSSSSWQTRRDPASIQYNNSSSLAFNHPESNYYQQSVSGNQPSYNSNRSYNSTSYDYRQNPTSSSLLYDSNITNSYDDRTFRDPESYYDQFSSPEAMNLGATSQQYNGIIPTATGFNNDCVEWVNSILYLFYTQSEKYGPIIGESVYRSLNEKLLNLTSSSSEYSHLVIEFEGINYDLSSRPELTNVRTECESDKSISVTCKIYNKRINLQLAIRRLLADHGVATQAVATSSEQHYELVLENLEGKLKSMAMLGDKLIVIQFIEKPDTKILLKPLAESNVYASTTVSSSRSNQLISEDMLVQMILQALTQVVVDLYFGNDIDFPQYTRHHHHQQQQSTLTNYKHKINNIFKGSASELKRSLKHDFFGSLSHQESNQNGGRERKVFVKIIQAKNINYNQNVTCLMELDSPKQQAISSTKQGSNPFWDEHFLFIVSEKSSELSFELWDSLDMQTIEQFQLNNSTSSTTNSPASTLKRQAKSVQRSPNSNNKSSNKHWQKHELTSSGAKFLGLARLQVDELRQNPVQKVSLTLQPAIGKPNDLSNSVGGELQLELLFLEHSSTSQTSGVPSSSQHPNLNKSEQPLHKSNSLSSLAYRQGDIVSIDRKLTPSGFVITTTTITKQTPPGSKVTPPLPSKYDQLLVRNQSPAGSSSMATEHSFDDMNLDAVSSSMTSEQLQRQGGVQASTNIDRHSEGAQSVGGGRLSRSRSRSRSFLRALRSRLSFSRSRARSVGGGETQSDQLYRPESGGSQSRQGQGLDFEDDRSRASSVVSVSGLEGGRAKSVPARPSRDQTMAQGDVPTIVINKGRLSDTASAYTFTRPKSQLVIEVLEPTLREDGNGNNKMKGIYRYYAIPEEGMKSAQVKKWRSRGTKLHVLNEHQFVADHLELADTCHICGRIFARRPGKQGYKCRNCHFLAHKKCHLLVDHICPYATRHLQLEFIDADPPARLVDEVRGQQQQQPPVGHDTGNDPYSQSATTTTGQRQTTSGRPNMRMVAKSISMEVEERL